MRAALAVAFACLAAAACGEDAPKVPDGHEPVTGSERLAWRQQAATAQELATFRYLVYVDDDGGSPLQSVTCGSQATAAGFECSGALPPLTAGAHALRLSAYVESGGARLESPRSDPLHVFKVAQTLQAVLAEAASSALKIEPARPSSLQATTADGIELAALEVAAGLLDPVDLAIAPDGVVYVAERGRVLVFRDGRLRPEPALRATDVPATGSHGIVSIAVDPQFERNAFVYLVSEGARGFQVARYRAVGDTLGDRAILLEGLPASPAGGEAAVRFGPDRRMYLGLDDGGDPRAGGDLGAFSGKILRLNPDATTPADQAGASPVYTANIVSPRGLDWDGAGTTMWVADERDGAGQLLVIEHASDRSGGRWGRLIARYNLPDAASGFDLAFYRGNLLPGLSGNLLVALEDARGQAGLLRLVMDPDDARTVSSTERLFHGSVDGARAIAVAPDGVIYFCTATALFRVEPAEKR